MSIDTSILRAIPPGRTRTGNEIFARLCQEFANITPARVLAAITDLTEDECMYACTHNGEIGPHADVVLSCLQPMDRPYVLTRRGRDLRVEYSRRRRRASGRISHRKNNKGPQ
jgi:hypothetical protein